MTRLFLAALTLGLLLTAPAVSARTIVVTDADNGKTVTLSQGDVLGVRLPANPTTGFTWHVVYDPAGPLSLSGKPRYVPAPHSFGVVGSGGTQEFHFTVPEGASFERGGWLRFLSLRPFESGVKDANLWEIKYTIKAAK